MGDQLITAIVSVLTAIIGVAIIATILSKNSATTNVISAGASGFSQMLGTALSPVTGSSGINSLVNGLSSSLNQTLLNNQTETGAQLLDDSGFSGY
jgi:hypothetical protein